jgi:hypothetical protein
MTTIEPKQAKLPQIKIIPIRGYESIKYHRPNTYLCVGMRGTGKSSLLEAIGCRYTKVIDLFGSKDAEALAWCKPESPFTSILFIIGENVKVASKWGTVEVTKLAMKDFEDHQVIVTTRSFYNTSYEYFQALQAITGLLWEKRTFWNEPWCVIIREAANLIYSRLQIVKDSNMAKSDFIQMLREARHSGLAVAVDTLRWTSLDKEIRDVSDYIFFKRLGAIGLPKDLSFIYRMIQPHAMMKLKPQTFIMLTTQGNIARGRFEYPLWHKEEKENIMLKLGIDIEYLGKEKEQSHNVAPIEHSNIITAYKEHKSMGKVAAKLNRSKDTIKRQIDLHNSNIVEVGYCLECHQAANPLEKEKIHKNKEPVSMIHH